MTHNPQAEPRVARWQWAALPPAAAVTTAVAYLAWLGWHQLEDKSAYEPWQVVGLGLTAGALVVGATWRSSPLGLVIAAAVTVSLTTVWSLDAATTHSEGANLWPVGAVFLLFGASFGLTVAWAVTLLLRRLVSRAS